MARYTITRELESGAYFPAPLKVRGITFLSEGGRAEGFAHATGESEADHYPDAVRLFELELLSILDALTISSVVGISSYGGSLFVAKEGSEYGYLRRYKSDRENITLVDLDEELVPELERTLDELSSEGAGGAMAAARHYRESLLYRSSLVGTIHLLRAAEAVAGSETSHPKCSSCHESISTCPNCAKPMLLSRTDRDRLEEMLGTPCYEFFYKKPGARNVLMHGGVLLEQVELLEQSQILRAGVQAALRDALSLPEHPPLPRARGLWAYRAFPAWLRTRSGWPPLSRLVELAESDRFHNESDPADATGDWQWLELEF